MITERDSHRTSTLSSRAPQDRVIADFGTELVILFQFSNAGHKFLTPKRKLKMDAFRLL